MPNSARSGHQGQVMILFAAASFVLIAILALAIDVGNALAEKRQTQAAADAAALAADLVYQRAPFGDPAPVAAIEESGEYYAEANGFAASEVELTPLATYTPPGGGELQRCVKATVTAPVDSFFIEVVYQGNWDVSATAVACTSPVERDYAIVTLDPDGPGINAFGTSNMTIHGGGAMSNSSMEFDGNTTWSQPGGALDAHDGISIVQRTPPSVTYESTNPAAPQIADPYADVAPPACGPLQTVPDLNTDPIILSPGTYSGISVSGGNAKNIVLIGGVYCFTGDFGVQSGKGNPRTVYGEDVLLYFQGSAELDIRGGDTGFSVSHTTLPSVIKNVAPAGVRDVLGTRSCTDPACDAEIVIFYNRSNCSNLSIEGGNRLNVIGIIYAPCSLITLKGHSGSQVVGQIIGGQAAFGGTTELTITYASSSNVLVPVVFLVQ